MPWNLYSNNRPAAFKKVIVDCFIIPSVPTQSRVIPEGWVGGKVSPLIPGFSCGNAFVVGELSRVCMRLRVGS